MCPGPVRTEMLEYNLTPMAEVLGTDIDGVFEALPKFVPLRRVASPEEVAGLCVYLAGDDSSYMTGSTIMIDGGTHYRRRVRLRRRGGRRELGLTPQGRDSLAPPCESCGAPAVSPRSGRPALLLSRAAPRRCRRRLRPSARPAAAPVSPVLVPMWY